MKRRSTGIIVAFVLATLGTLLMVAYVQSAKNDAVAGERLVDVVVVTKTVPAGTAVSDLAGSVAERQVPAKVVVDGAISDLTEVKDLVADVDLLPGEQLSASRFVTAAVASRGDVPKELMEVTVAIEPVRALGGTVRAGDKVGVALSFEPFELSGMVGDGPNGEVIAGALPEDAKTPNSTHLEVRKAIVTEVSAEQKLSEPAPETEAAGAPAVAPTGNILVTLAVSPNDAEQVIFAAEFGTIWLTGETDDVPEGDTRIVTRGNVYEGKGIL